MNFNYIFHGRFLDQSSAPGSANAEDSGLLSGDYVDLGLFPFKISSSKPSEDEWEGTRPELIRYPNLNFYIVRLSFLYFSKLVLVLSFHEQKLNLFFFLLGWMST